MGRFPAPCLVLAAYPFSFPGVSNVNAKRFLTKKAMILRRCTREFHSRDSPHGSHVHRLLGDHIAAPPSATDGAGLVETFVSPDTRFRASVTKLRNAGVSETTGCAAAELRAISRIFHGKTTLCMFANSIARRRLLHGASAGAHSEILIQGTDGPGLVGRASGCW